MPTIQGVHIVTLFEHRELLAEIEMIFVRFPDLAVLRFSDSAFSTAFTRARNAANSSAHMRQVFLTGGVLLFGQLFELLLLPSFSWSLKFWFSGSPSHTVLLRCPARKASSSDDLYWSNDRLASPLGREPKWSRTGSDLPVLAHSEHANMCEPAEILRPFG